MSIKEPSKETVYDVSGTRLINVDCRTKGAFIIEEGTADVCTDAFLGCNDITTLRIPASIKRFAWDSFRECNGIKEVFFDGSVEQWCKITFDSSTAAPCRHGAKLYIRGFPGDILAIPNTIETIKGYAFCGVAKKTINIPPSVKIIMMGAFMYCSELVNVNLTEGLQQIGSSAFYCCEQLESIALPDSLNAINAHAFAGTRALKHLYIPASVIVVADAIARDNLDIEFYLESRPKSTWPNTWNKVRKNSKTARANTHYNIPRWWYEQNVAKTKYCYTPKNSRHLPFTEGDGFSAFCGLLYKQKTRANILPSFPLSFPPQFNGVAAPLFPPCKT